MGVKQPTLGSRISNGRVSTVLGADASAGEELEVVQPALGSRISNGRVGTVLGADASAGEQLEAVAGCVY